MHGGDIYRNEVDLDFSVNINPQGVYKKVNSAMKKALLEVEHYPDLNCQELICGLSKQYGVSEDGILCGNGASELIDALAESLRPEKVILLSPGFEGYDRAFKVVGSEIIKYRLKEENQFMFDMDSFLAYVRTIALEDKTGKTVGYTVEDALDYSTYTEAKMMVVLTNPHNPTGQLISPEDMSKIADCCREVDAFLCIDECFMDLTKTPDRYTFVKNLPEHGNVCILNAFTKSFAIPGVRLGFLFSENKSLVSLVKDHLPEWNVSVIAQKCGLGCLDSFSELTDARSQIVEDREDLVSGLKKLDWNGREFRIYPSDVNFILFSYKDKCMDLYEQLIKRKILIRKLDCEGVSLEPSRKIYRIAVRKKSENQLLIDAINEILWEYC